MRRPLLMRPRRHLPGLVLLSALAAPAWAVDAADVLQPIEVHSTRSDDGVMSDFKPSLGYLALTNRCGILPMYLGRTHDAMPKGALWPRRGARVEVHIGRFFSPEAVVALSRGLGKAESYRQVGTCILMENDKGETRSFLVTRMDDKTLTVDGNNPLCGREVVFTLEIRAVRNATDEETRAGGATVAGADIDPSLMRPV